MSIEANRSFTALLASLSPDAHTRGKQFERVAKWWLTQDPIRSLDVKQAWLWDEWPNRSGSDIGIDIVAEMFDGTLCAIQAKCFDENRDIPKSELDSFVSAASHRTFQHRWLIATTDRLSANARRMLDDQHVTRIMRSDLEESLDVWPASIDELNPTPRVKSSPRPHQQQAITDVVAGLSSNSRGQLLMACGTGKTLTALWIKEALKPRTTLVLVPSLNLLAQTLSEWAKNTSSPWNYLCVCSDDTVNKADDQPISTVGDLPFDVTTNAEQISAFLSLGGEKIIFSTYQSSAQVAKAQELTATAFDLVICDEAHRLTGKTDAGYATVLDEKKIVAEKRLFMTATPRTYTTAAKSKAEGRGVEITSMDDEHIYGPVLHKLSFGEAIKQELLSDYRVLIVGVTNPQVQDLIDRRELVSVNDSVTTDARTLAAHIGLAKATKDYNLKRTISFHSRIKTAEQFAQDHAKILEWLPESHKPSGDTWTGTISGAMNTSDRRKLLTQLRLDGEDRHAILANARCLTEGVDVPSLDGVAFIDPRSSQVDIIQAVGRAIRKSEYKELGTIVLPVLIPIETDLELALEDTAFKPIWAVLNALKSHDEELAMELNELRTQLGRNGVAGALPHRIVEDLPIDIDSLLPGFADQFSIAIIEQSTSNWDWWLGLLLAVTTDVNIGEIDNEFLVDGHRLGQWCGVQRSHYLRGWLKEERIQKLELVPNWVWNKIDQLWDTGYDELQVFVREHGHATVPVAYITQNKFRLGQWTQVQRTEYRKNKLSKDRQIKLESLNGWTWHLKNTRWYEKFELFRLNGHVGGDYSVIPDVQFGEFNPAKWASRQRLRKSDLSQDKIEVLEKLPNWTWDPRLDRFNFQFQELFEWVEEHGHSQISQKDDWNGKTVGYFVQRSRQDYKKGKLTEDQIQKFEQLPGWSWAVRDDNWFTTFATLAEIYSTGSTFISEDQLVNGKSLKVWISEQRTNKKRGALAPDRIAQLNSLKLWTW